MRTVGAAMLVGLMAEAACSSKDPDTETNTAGAAGSSKGGGGGGGMGATAGRGGRGGNSSQAGKAPMPSDGGEGGGTAAGAAGEAGAELGGAAGAPPMCPGCESGFCLEDGTCVDCLASNDHCPLYQYCTAANECAPGCKADGSSCVSGVCGSDRNCENCINDDECIGDNVCGDGKCAAACTVAQEGTPTGCSDGLTCCSLHCSELRTDSQHCGSCSNACDAGQFCGHTLGCGEDGAGGAGGAGPDAAACVSCHDVVLANVCSITQVIVILDASEGNGAPGKAIGNALEAQCNPKPTLSQANQADSEALNFTTGRPVSGGGELLVISGGPFFQHVEGYLENQRISPLYWFYDATSSGYRKSANDETIISLDLAGDHDSHDFFIVQFMRDPASGSLVLNAQGLWLSGTVAAGYLVTNGILPNLASYDKAWYAYEWTDADGDKQPDLGEIELRASGL